ncbi:MAG: AsmA family protein [Hyphomicrobiaceae bacterium]
MPVAPDKPRRSLWRRPLILIPVGLILALALGLVALVVAPPIALVREQLVRVVEDATGREFKVAGAVKLAFYPKPSLILEDVTLAGPPDAAGPELVRAERIAGEVNPLALLSGRTEISRLEIVRPTLTLRPEDRSLLDRVSQSQSGGIGLKADELVFRQITITDGSVNYLVRQPNPSWRIDQASATFADTAGNGETKGSGSFRWRDDKVTFSSVLADARAYARGETSPLSVKFDMKNLVLELQGELSPKDGPQVKGTLLASTHSMRDLARWLDVDPGAYALKGPASFTGAMLASADQIALAKAALKMEAGDSIWDTQIRFGELRPQVTGNIAWRQLDLQRLLGETPKVPALALQARSVDVGTALPSAWQALGAQLDALNAAPGVALSALAAPSSAPTDRSSWSVETLDLDALTTVNLNLTTAADLVTHGSVQMQDARADILLHDGRLTYTLKQIGIDKGRATGRVDVDATSKPAKVALSLSASDVPTEKVLAQLVNNAVITGAAKLDLVVAGQGRNAQEVLKTLDGKVDMTIEKGRLIGFNLRRALLEWWRSWSYDPAQRTSFDKITGNYGIRDGVVHTIKDLSLIGPEIEITSSGTVTLPSQTLDQKVRLKAFPPPQHLAVPLRVGGSWERPSISWDWLSVFSDPSISAAPTSVTTSPEPVPAEVKARIEQTLNGPNADRLPPQVREMLQALASQ